MAADDPSETYKEVLVGRNLNIWGYWMPAGRSPNWAAGRAAIDAMSDDEILDAYAEYDEDDEYGVDDRMIGLTDALGWMERAWERDGLDKMVKLRLGSGVALISGGLDNEMPDWQNDFDALGRTPVLAAIGFEKG